MNKIDSIKQREREKERETAKKILLILNSSHIISLMLRIPGVLLVIVSAKIADIKIKKKALQPNLV